jgi:hypothetical protein
MAVLGVVEVPPSYNTPSVKDDYDKRWVKKTLTNLSARFYMFLSEIFVLDSTSKLIGQNILRRVKKGESVRLETSYLTPFKI